MAKKKLGAILSESVNESKQKGGLKNLRDTIITTPEQLKNLSSNVKKEEQKEKREAAGMTYLTQTEMDAFLGLIGRKSFSDAARELILGFIAKNKS